MVGVVVSIPNICEALYPLPDDDSKKSLLGTAPARYAPTLFAASPKIPKSASVNFAMY